jgi:uncharacterized protein (TIRG00374 family)
MRPRSWLAVSVLLSVLIFAIVLGLTVDETTFEALDRLDLRWLLVALGAHGCALVCWSGRLRLLSSALGYRVPLRRCLSIVLANVLASAITPSSAGGEPVRVHELYRSGVRAGDATAVVVTERLLDFLLLLVGVNIAVLLLGHRLKAIGVDAGAIVPAVWLLVTGLFAIVLLVLWHPTGLNRGLRATGAWLSRLLPSRFSSRVERFTGKVDREADHFRASFHRFAVRGRGHLAAALACSAGYWLFDFLVASFVLLALGLPPFWIESLLCQMFVNVISLLPVTPGGAGIAELTAASLYGLFVPSSALGVMIVLWRLIVYHLNILLGLGAGLAIVRREAARRALLREP